MIALRCFLLLAASRFVSSIFQHKQYALTSQDKIPKGSVFMTKTVSNKIHCASLCMNEAECKGFGFDAQKTCSLIKDRFDDQFCSKTECNYHEGMKIYMLPQDDTITTTKAPTTTSTMTPTTTTKTPTTTTTKPTTTEKPTTTTEKPTTTTEKPTTTTKKPTTTTKKPTTTTEKPTTTTKKPTTTTKKPTTTTKKPTTTTKKPTTTTKKPTTTTEKPTTATEKLPQVTPQRATPESVTIPPITVDTVTPITVITVTPIKPTEDYFSVGPCGEKEFLYKITADDYFFNGDIKGECRKIEIAVYEPESENKTFKAGVKEECSPLYAAKMLQFKILGKKLEQITMKCAMLVQSVKGAKETVTERTGKNPECKEKEVISGIKAEQNEDQYVITLYCTNVSLTPPVQDNAGEAIDGLV